MSMGNWIDQRIKVKSRQIRILGFNEDNIRLMIPEEKSVFEIKKISDPIPTINLETVGEVNKTRQSQCES